MPPRSAIRRYPNRHFVEPSAAVRFVDAARLAEAYRENERSERSILMIDTDNLPSKLPIRRRRSNRARSRWGAATVELALSLPVLLTISLGMMETCNLMLVQARMQSAAYEAVRYAVRPTTSQATAASSTQVNTYATTLLSQLGVVGATITLNPSDLSTVTPLTLVTVTISAPFNQNSLTTFVLSKTTTTTAQATMAFE